MINMRGYFYQTWWHARFKWTQSDFTRIAATDDGTTITNSDTTKEAVLAINNEDSYIYHGNINGNIKLTHNINSQDKKTNAKLILMVVSTQK